jgi:hypothetical protein
LCVFCNKLYACKINILKTYFVSDKKEKYKPISLTKENYYTSLELNPSLKGDCRKYKTCQKEFSS